MRSSEKFFRLALFGMKHEAEDIIDYIAIRFSLLGSLFVGIGTGIWIGRAASVWSGLLAGFAVYGISMSLCTLAFLLQDEHHRGHRATR